MTQRIHHTHGHQSATYNLSKRKNIKQNTKKKQKKKKKIKNKRACPLLFVTMRTRHTVTMPLAVLPISDVLAAIGMRECTCPVISWQTHFTDIKRKHNLEKKRRQNRRQNKRQEESRNPSPSVTIHRPAHTTYPDRGNRRPSNLRRTRRPRSP